MVAYSLYKRQKIEWIGKFKADNGGIDPSDDDIERGFSRVSNLASQIQWYRGEAVLLLDSFLDEALAQKLEEERKAIRDDAIVRAVNKGIFRSVGENLLSGLIASLLTIAAAGLFWAAAKGPENLMREALSDFMKTQPQQAKPQP